mmetsp:Transcript_935/g.1625  ORF Transcript_935/g.1625 Transcript_935/m.1625 type:complete len:295 (-) Transcript_935:245-1129(-)
MQVYQFVTAFVVLGTAIPALLHFNLHGQFNTNQVACAFFCNLNILINLWEIALGWHISYIHKQFLELKERYKGNEFAAVTEFFLMPMGVADALSLKFWCAMADAADVPFSLTLSPHTFFSLSSQDSRVVHLQPLRPQLLQPRVVRLLHRRGQRLDHARAVCPVHVGRDLRAAGAARAGLAGLSHVLPGAYLLSYLLSYVLCVCCVCMLYVVCCVCELGCSRRALSLMCLSWVQEFYGTVIYFLSYVFNGRYKGKPVSEVLLFVGLSNGLWFFFPLLGMALSADMLYTDSFAAFR